MENNTKLYNNLMEELRESQENTAKMVDYAEELNNSLEELNQRMEAMNDNIRMDNISMTALALNIKLQNNNGGF